MQLLTSQKNQIYNYLTVRHYFSPNQFKLEEIEYKNKILAITLYLQGNTTYMTNAYSVIK